MNMQHWVFVCLHGAAKSVMAAEVTSSGIVERG